MLIARSRNNMLSEADRRAAPCINQALQWAAAAAASREVTSAEELSTEVGWRIADGGGIVDYVEVRELPRKRP